METEKSHKQILEEEKLRIEIEELRKKWYKRPNYLQILLPTTVAVGSLLYAISSGVFTTKYDQYLLQQERLKLETMRFEIQRDEMRKQVEDTQNENSNLNYQLKVAVNKKELVRKALEKIQNTLETSKNQLVLLENEKRDYINKISLLDSSFQVKEKVLIVNIDKLESLKKQLKSDIYDFAYTQDVLLDSLKKLQNVVDVQKDEIDKKSYEIAIRKNPFKNLFKDVDYESKILEATINSRRAKFKENNYAKIDFDKEMKELNRRHYEELKRLEMMTVEEVIEEFNRNFSKTQEKEEQKLKPIFKTKKD